MIFKKAAPSVRSLRPCARRAALLRWPSLSLRRLAEERRGGRGGAALAREPRLPTYAHDAEDEDRQGDDEHGRSDRPAEEKQDVVVEEVEALPQGAFEFGRKNCGQSGCRDRIAVAAH